MKRLLLFLLILLMLFGCKYTTQILRNDIIVCINFDDNCASVYENALPVMTQYGFRGTVFTNSGYVGLPNRLTWSQLDSLKHSYNWEIGGHTLYHEALSELTYDEAEYTIATDFNNLKAHGYNPKSFATTFGVCPVGFYPLIMKYYQNVRTCFNTSMHCPIDRSQIGSFPVENWMSPQQIVNRVTQGMVEKENLIVFLFHDISATNTDYFDNCDPQTFAEVMRLIHSKDVLVMPLNEAIDYLSD